MDEAFAVTDVERPPGEPGGLRARLCVGAAHPVLGGHFPERPIVPGVMLLDAVRQACAQAYGRPMTLVAVDDARFTTPLLPDQVAELTATVVAPAAGADADQVPEYAVDGEWRGEAGRIAAFRLRLLAGD